MKKRYVSAIFAVVLACSSTPTASASSYGQELIMPYRFYKRLARCETNSNIAHSQKNYTSAFGIARGTWQRYSNSSSAINKSFIEQARIVDRISFLGFTGPDGKYVWPAGPWGFATIKYQNCLGLQGFICRATHPKVQRWKRGC